MLTDPIRKLIESDMLNFDTAARNHAALRNVRQRSLRIGPQKIIIQHNPARAVSAAAPVDSSSIASRPCFLCRGNRPATQGFVGHGEWQILVNPYPILPNHLTIAHASHIPQVIGEHIADMVRFTKELPGYTVFYNGAECGASAPDHLHLQAVPSEYLPLWSDIANYGPGIFVSDRLPAAIVITCDSDSRTADMAEKVLSRLPEGADGSEPRVNILCRHTGEFFRMAIIPRRHHRPEDYTSSPDDPGGIMVSPGALDTAGIVVTPRSSDYLSLTPEKISEIFNYTGYTAEEINAILPRL